MAATLTRLGDREMLGSETTNPRIQMWYLGGRSLRVAYPEVPYLQLRLRRYRSLLVALAMLVGGAVAWQVYRRLGRPATASLTRGSPTPGGEST